MIIVVLIDFLILIKLFPFYTNLEKQRKIIDNSLIIIMKHIFGNKKFDFKRDIF